MGRQGQRKTLARGIYRDASGFEVTVSVGSGPAKVSRSKRYPAKDEPTIREMKCWQDETRVELRKVARDTKPGTLETDVPLYLAKVTETLATIKDRERDVRAWLPTFGHRRRSSLTTRELDAKLRHWRNVDKLSASTCNHRRDALSDLFQKLGGEGASNPVKGCVWFRRPAPVPQGISRARILKVLTALSSEGKTRWRLLLMHWTGMRPSQMARLRDTGEDFYLDDRAFHVELGGAPVPAVLVPAGKGGQPVMFPLTVEAVETARGFLRTDAYGKWSCPSAYKRIVEAAKKVEERPFNVYRIKHSFASALRRSGTDLADIQDMLGHADISSTRVYAPAVQAKHVAALERLRADDARQYDAGSQEAVAGTTGWHPDAPSEQAS